ncbi:MAG: photosynthetic reaction center cytochrome c subunit [Burkholderiales bacterium]|nr:photosynthetic reaction center cytochrome c subunit [Burkholderiales bacterium]
MPTPLLSRALPLLALVGAAALLSGCERPPPNTEQTGYRGTGMVQVSNPRLDAAKLEANQAPAPLPPAAADGPKAGTIYQNVKVLGDLSVGEFTRTMLAMTQWVAPQQGCGYCHNLQNLADDSLYTKRVARRMLQMTEHVNADWKTHVGATGVTCYTCHRGNHVPAYVWYTAAPRDYPGITGGASGEEALQDKPSPSVDFSSLPYDPFTPYLLGHESIRAAGLMATTGRLQPMLQTEKTYGLMVHMAGALGVNCTYCHNTRNFATWENSNPARVTAWYGIRMARELNVDYLGSLAGTFPPKRLGPTGDVAKVNCLTCHQGVFKPLYGAQMAKDYPALLTVSAPAPDAPASAAAPAAPAASAATASAGTPALTLAQAATTK